MDINFISEVLKLADQYLDEAKNSAEVPDIQGFKSWVARTTTTREEDVPWEGKENSRTPESVISTMVVRMNRYGKNYLRAAIEGSGLASTDDMIYLITLQAFGPLTKMELIRRNVHDKSAGMSIINRLIKNNLVTQKDNPGDARSKLTELTRAGQKLLKDYMVKVRAASKVVTARLSPQEKLILITLFNKLDFFHKEVYSENISDDQLLTAALSKINSSYE